MTKYLSQNARTQALTSPDDESLAALAGVIEKAMEGDASTVPIIRQAIIKNPHVVEVFGGNVAKVAEDSFVNALSGKDLVFRETLIAKLATLRGQLNGPNPTPLEKLLVERVVACWLQVQDADIRFAQAKDTTLALADFGLRRMNFAHKRYLSALKTLALIRKLAIPAVQINIARRQVNQLNTAPQVAPPRHSEEPMTTSKQIAANRTNALISTGPTTASGRATVSQNALKLGVYSLRPVVADMETDSEWEDFRFGLISDLAPIGALEQALAERIAGYLWRLRRVTRYESDVIDTNRKDWLIYSTKADNLFIGVLTQDRKKLRKALEKLESAKRSLDHCEKAASYFQRTTAGDPGDPIEGADLLQHLWSLGKCFFPDEDDLETIEILNHAEFLNAIQAPSSPGRTAPWKRPGWTVAHACRAVTHLMVAYADEEPRPLDELLRHAIDEGRQQVSEAENDHRELDTEFSARLERIAAARSMPDEKETAKIARYESHLSRQMTQALHELQRLQATRAGAAFPPPTAIDVTIQVSEGGEGNYEHEPFAKQSQSISFSTLPALDGQNGEEGQ